MDSQAIPASGFEGVDLSRRTDWRKLMKLECEEKPSLTEEQFLGLFIPCDSAGCHGLITTGIFCSTSITVGWTRLTILGQSHPTLWRSNKFRVENWFKSQGLSRSEGFIRLLPALGAFIE